MVKKLEKSIINGLINIKDHWKDNKFHDGFNRKADIALKNIESVQGKTNQKHIKMSDEYALDVLGSKKYAPWLYVYSALNSKFKEGWIPENYYNKVVSSKIQGDYGWISKLKPLSKIIYQSDLFPDIAYYVNGLFFDVNRKIIRNQDLKDNIFSKTDKIVFKADKFAGGRGVIVLTHKTFSVDKVYTMGNGVFQRYINQHPFFDKYMPNSVATLRLITTINNDGNTQLRGGHLRMGRSDDVHVKANTHVRVPINKDNGELYCTGYLPNWKPVLEHPDSKELFVGNKIPNFDKCKKTALLLHKKMPYSLSVGWDMIVNSENNIELIECQGITNSVALPEATQGPCFSDLGWENLWKE